jgi:tetratricopeptide (TPR) repeat protein
MFRRVFFAVFFLLSIVCNAQQDNKRVIDSLYKLIQSHHKKDTGYVKLLNNYSRVVRFDSVDVAMQYARDAILLAKELGEEYWIGQGFSSIAMAYLIKGQSELAIQYLDSSQVLFAGHNHYVPLKVCLSLKGAIFRELGKYADAVDMHYEAIKIAEKMNNAKEKAASYVDIGAIYSDIGMYKESILNYKQALNEFLSSKDTLYIGLCHSNIAYSYYYLKDYSAAKLEFDTAIRLYNSIKRFDAAAGSKAGLAPTFAYLYKYDTAMSLIKEAIQSATERKNKNSLGGCNINAAKIILFATDSIKNAEFNYRNALKYALAGYELVKEVGNKKMQVIATEVISEIYFHLKDYSNAYSFFRKHSHLKDSISGANKVQEIAIKGLQFENEKKSAVIEAKHLAELNQQKTNRNFLMGGAGLVIVASGILFWSFQRRRDAKSKQQEAELKAEIADTEMKVMRLQMNPHFIFNSLNSISDYIQKNNSQEADVYLSKFAKVMRMTLENSEQQAIPLEDDLMALELYMQLEAKRLNDKFTYEIKVADDIDKENTLVPPMIFQPFVENSIWHGISKKEGKGHILIEIRKEGEMLHCVIDDDGIGRKGPVFDTNEAAIKEKRSLGMKITKARIDMENKLWGSKADIRLTDKEKGMKAELILPLRTSF